WVVANFNDFSGLNPVISTYVGYVKVSTTGVIDPSSAVFQQMPAAGTDTYGQNEITVGRDGSVFVALNQINSPYEGAQTVLFKLDNITNYPNFNLIGPINQSNLEGFYNPLAGFLGPSVSFQEARGVPI